MELDFCILAALHVAIQRGAPILERQKLSEMHKKVQGQDLAPDPLKRAFFSIEIRSFWALTILDFWEVCPEDAFLTF